MLMHVDNIYLRLHTMQTLPATQTIQDNVINAFRRLKGDFNINEEVNSRLAVACLENN